MLQWIPTVEGIALKVGISKATLYRLVKTDQEFSQTLEALKTMQENDPFKTRKAEGAQLNATMIVLLLIEKAKSKYS